MLSIYKKGPGEALLEEADQVLFFIPESQASTALCMAYRFLQSCILSLGGRNIAKDLFVGYDG
jgi:hypothetical protein